MCAEFLFICLFVFPLMGKAEVVVLSADDLYFCFVCCLDEDATASWVMLSPQVVSFVGVLMI